jgi:hypothetical protein
MSYASQVKYSPLTALHEEDGSSVLDIRAMDKKESAFNFESEYTYNLDPDSNNYTAAKDNYRSAFKYNNMTAGRQSGHLAVDIDNRDINKNTATSRSMVITSLVITFLSYLFFLVTIPITYWFFVKKLGEFDRLVVFRLGKLVGVKGPGRVIIFPWMDRTKK